MLDLFDKLSKKYDDISPYDFYRDIFPVGSFQRKGEYEKGKYNGIIVEVGKNNNKEFIHRHTLTDEFDKLNEILERDNFCIMSPISYIGKERKSDNARFLYALAIDLDGITTENNWKFLLKQIDYGHEMLAFVWGIPRPTYIVASGTGLHLYFVFEEPIPLFKNIVKELEVLRRRITWQAWTQGASTLHDNVQYESLFQGFRVVGTITKNGKRAKAFKVGEKITVEYLNSFVPEQYKAKSFAYKSRISLSEAKEKYKDWYDRRIIKKQPKGSWVCKEDLYNWWINRLLDGAEQGHRYWCLMTLATYAKKCGISREKLEKDAFDLRPVLDSRGDEFSIDDVMHALECYNDSYITYPIDTIVSRTGIEIKKNKRNGRKQEVHLAGARAIQKVNDEFNGTNWREGNGRKSKQNIVLEWKNNNPTGKKIECHRDTKLSRPTIDKWWNSTKQTE